MPTVAVMRARLMMQGTPGHRDQALAQLKQACHAVCGSADNQSDRFAIESISAFIEAFSNIALHSYAGDPAGAIELVIAARGPVLTMKLVDWGRPFDLEAITPPDLEQLPESGLGMFIVGKWMDRVRYRPGPPNVLLLQKRR